MGKYDDYYQAVDKIEQHMRCDLIGPVKANEVIIGEEPLSYYVLGILWPKHTESHSKTSLSEDTENEFAELEDEDLEDGTTENDNIVGSNKYKPSVMAISAMLPADAEKLHVCFSFAKYKYSEEDGEKYKIKKYTRAPHNVSVAFDIPNKTAVVRLTDVDLYNLYGINIELTVRKFFENGSKLITVSVINETVSPQKSVLQNESALFQCELTLSFQNGTFIPIYKNETDITDIETLTSNMLYSDVFNYAYGHGCSVKWEEKKGKVNKISSDFIPSAEVLQMMPNTLKNETFLYMAYWKNSDKCDAIQKLSDFIAEYENWCSLREKESTHLIGYTKAAQYAILNIKTCVQRLKNGVKTLAKHETAWKAFCLMNEAMMLQRVKTKDVSEENVKWYPFQLAYILMIIPDIAEDKSVFREFVDLLWFPTGGGKTESYLGVSAFVIFYRRLMNNFSKDGVTVIMRYTLRLLTIQQFERATALICAMEFLRKRDNICGGEISIGLWIGSNMTPNHIDDAVKKINELKEDPDKRILEGNPQQITDCPWCKAKIDIGCYNIIDRILVISCKNNTKCDFHRGLPVYLVDDDIYNKCPTLILSTIDKFARIVWEEKTKALFGKGEFLPPELIIQDELHLISGPLGSIAGIYESAIQKLCEVTGRTPKIIASTATVKNAKDQIKNLYDKNMFQFPPNGLSAKDSFFAIMADRDKRPARRYIGLCETGGSMADLLLRVYSNLFFLKSLFEKQGMDNDVIDQYFTTIGYFNAIKNLGASSSIISDRISSFIKTLITHKFKEISEEYNLELKDTWGLERHDELTSRKTSKEVKETLERLTRPYGDDLCYSYVLASNMLSVGIDIDRLGVMSVYNQPKSNAEYIQATSRVGRSKPGVVFALYNGIRSRDKSHYEQFVFYHRTFYQYVEATSVTPFSARAMEKALHGIFVALVRHTVRGMSGNNDAAKFRINLTGVPEILDYMIDRISNINIEAATPAKEYLEWFIEEWEHLAKTSRDTFVYTDYSGNICLLNAAEKKNDTSLPATLNALRNVDRTANVYIKRRES